MSQNILIISTSPRCGGNTEKLCDAFTERAVSAGKEVKKLNINDWKILPCMGCDACQGNGGHCVLKDDMSRIIESMQQADAVVFATPVYFYNMSGQMKVLLDRTYPQYRDLFALLTIPLRRGQTFIIYLPFRNCVPIKNRFINIHCK